MYLFLPPSLFLSLGNSEEGPAGSFMGDLMPIGSPTRVSSLEPEH